MSGPFGPFPGGDGDDDGDMPDFMRQMSQAMQGMVDGFGEQNKASMQAAALDLELAEHQQAWLEACLSVAEAELALWEAELLNPEPLSAARRKFVDAKIAAATKAVTTNKAALEAAQRVYELKQKLAQHSMTAGDGLMSLFGGGKTAQPGDDSVVSGNAEDPRGDVLPPDTGGKG